MVLVPMQFVQLKEIISKTTNQSIKQPSNLTKTANLTKIATFSILLSIMVVTTAHDHPPFFSPTTGIYTSNHPPIPLPQSPIIDLVTHLFSSFDGYDDNVALVDSLDGSSISYLELKQLVSSVATGLRSIGICKKDVIFMLLPNTIFFPVVYLGGMATGAVISPLNPLSTFEEIRKHVLECGIRSIAFVSSANSSKVETLGVRVIVEVPESLNYDPLKFSVFNKILFPDPCIHLTRPSIRRTDTTVLLRSSGTSGESKCVVITHENLISAVELFVRFEVSQYTGKKWENNVYLCILPMFHIYGLSLFATGLFSLGTTVVVMRRFEEEGAARAIGRFRITHFPVVPSVLDALVRMQRTGGYDFSSLKQVSSGAAPLSKKIIREFMTTFPEVDFVQGYGMTETTAVGSRGFNKREIQKYCSVGLLAPNMEAKVVDVSSGLCLGPGLQGELWLRGPAIMKGYLNNEIATSRTINADSWLMTGDIAYFDEDGYLYIVDRLKEIIKYNGYQIAPADLEAVLIMHPEVADAGVTAVPDDEVGELPVAFIVKQPGSNLSATEVMAYTAKLVAPYKKVRKVVFVDSIPRSPAGKILRRLLRKRMLSKM